jgi:hypothetical protein
MKSAGWQERPDWAHNGLRKQDSPYSQDVTSSPNKYNGNPVHDKSPEHRRRDEEDLTVEDISGLDAGYDADVEIINPYLYEDADSDSNTPSNIPTKSRIDFDDLWKHGIVDSMKSLDCNSEKDDDPARMPYKRGVKRKPKDTTEKLKPNETPPSRGSPFEVVEIDNRGFSPRKIRRGRRVDAQGGYPSYTTATAPSDESSSVQPQSTEGSRSSAEPDDAMDIDNSTP